MSSGTGSTGAAAAADGTRTGEESDADFDPGGPAMNLRSEGETFISYRTRGNRCEG